jgi:hypothetical protein
MTLQNSKYSYFTLFLLAVIAIQLFINVKRGIVVTPFYHYGMYATKMELTDTVIAFELKNNGKVLSPFQFSAQQWDALMLPLFFYKQADNTNRLQWQQNIQRILQKVSIYPNSALYTGKPSAQEFSKAYTNLAYRITGSSISVEQLSLLPINGHWQIISRQKFIP